MTVKKKPSLAGLGRTENINGRYHVQSDCIPIRVGNQVVGQVKGDTFYKSIRASKHMLKIPPAIAFDVSTLKDAERAGAMKVQVTDSESGTVYKATIAQIWRGGFRVNRRFGKQIALPLQRWTMTRRGLLEQLPLFEVVSI